MKKLLLVICLFVVTMASAQMPDAPFGFGGQQKNDNAARYSVKYADINYADDESASHTLDIYLPEVVKDKYPVVVHIYGSAWFSNSSKGVADINTICAALLDAGYAIVCPNHRASTEAKYPAQINDIKAVVRFLRANADKYKLDTSFIATSGFSSGAHLASLMAATNGVKVGKCGDREVDIEGSVGKYTDQSSTVDACCEWSGPIDLLNMDCDGIEKPKNSPEEVVMGMPKEGNENSYKLLNTTYFVDSTDVPIGIFHGKEDNVVPNCQGDLLYNALQSAGVKSFLVKHPGGGHGFNMYTPENLRIMVEWFDSARLGK